MTGEKCYCGHAERSHHSRPESGIRHYTGCKFCDCLQYYPKSYGKEEWERLQKLQHEVHGYPLPFSFSDIKRKDNRPLTYCNPDHRSAIDAQKRMLKLQIESSQKTQKEVRTMSEKPIKYPPLSGFKIKTIEDLNRVLEEAEYDMYLQECPVCKGKGRVSRRRLQDLKLPYKSTKELLNESIDSDSTRTPP